MKCAVMKFNSNVKTCRKRRDETRNAKIQDAMQDAVRDEHKQMGMPMPPKVLCHEHDCPSARSVNDDKDTKEQERE